jgi:hypothetical protein
MNIRLTVLLVFVLVVFAALALYFRPWAQVTPNEDEPWLYRIDDDAIVHVEVTHQGKTMVYDKDLGRGKWFIVEGEERSPVFQDKWAGTPLLLSGPRVNRVLSDTIENPAQYGLEPPESIIQVTEETGLVYEFWLGNKTPDEDYNYTRLVGDPKLFTVPEIWAMVVNRLVNEPPLVPPPAELGYFYDVAAHKIEELEVTHNGVTVSYAPDPDARIWYATRGEERLAVKPPRWWDLQLQWFAKPGKPGGPDNPGGWLVSEDDAQNPEYGLSPPDTVVRVRTEDETQEFYIGGGYTEVDDDGQPLLDDHGNTQVLVHYAGLSDDPIVYVINAVRAARTVCLVTDVPVEAPYDCPSSAP